MEAHVDSILVIGTDTTIGAHLVASQRDHLATVSGIAWSELEGLSGPAALEEARRRLGMTSPDRVVYCDAQSEGAWSDPTINGQTETRLRTWVRAIREFGCEMTYITSDAIFTGPWLFHAEDDVRFCASPQAERLRTMEEVVSRVVPEALIVRTHVFGWSADGQGWMEETLASLENRTAQGDPSRHATPVMVSDFVEILDRAHEEGVRGVLHIAGAERVSHEAFLRGLAQQFRLPGPKSWQGGLTRRPTGFGRGETSLRTNRVKDLLNLSMPMPRQGYERLAEQIENGERETLYQTAMMMERAA